MTSKSSLLHLLLRLYNRLKPIMSKHLLLCLLLRVCACRRV